MTDPITEAANSLRDDPTFPLMSLPDSREEAKALLASLGGDPEDPLAVALVLEQAKAAPPVQASYRPPQTVEGCGEQRERCNAPVAGNGRCMECGANRTLVAAPEPTPVSYRVADVVTASPVTGDLTPLLYRFKNATGFSEPMIAGLIGKSRATVSHYISGRLPEILDDQARAAMCAAVVSQRKLLERLEEELQ